MQTIQTIFRKDPTNVGDWYCTPGRYFGFQQWDADILKFDADALSGNVVLGGGGLIAKTFHGHMERLASLRPQVKSLVAWGIGENENVDRTGGFVLPFVGRSPEYMKNFDLVGIRDYGSDYPWVPCASCMLSHFDLRYEVKGPVGIYDHKRIIIPIDGFPRRTNEGSDIDGTMEFLASYELIITNSYHGAYWATLLGRRVVCIPNMSKVYRFKHAPVFCRPESWKRYADCAVAYPEALEECREANRNFHSLVQKLWSTTQVL